MADLLLNPGQTDTIKFDSKFSNKIEWLGSAGISWEVFLQGLNDKEIKVVLKNIKAKIKDSCSICWEDFEREVFIPYFETKFVVPAIHQDLSEQIHDEEFLINTKNDTINLEELITQSIILAAPLTPYCAQHSWWEFEETQSDEIPLSWSIVFKKM